MKQDKLRIISAKDLGKLNMPDFCPACFWIERHIDKLPGIFPGIFSTLDAITKRSAHRSFLERGKAPDWLNLNDLIDIEEGDICFKFPVEYGNWILVGRPDDIFKTKSNAYHIIDYKTAKFTSRQDELLPLYEVQLNCYAYLAEKYGFNPVEKLSLVYCQPNEDLDNDHDFKLTFQTYYLEIEIDQETVKNLLIKSREILNYSKPPSPAINCKGICQWTKKAINFLFDK